MPRPWKYKFPEFAKLIDRLAESEVPDLEAAAAISQLMTKMADQISKGQGPWRFSSFSKDPEAEYISGKLKDFADEISMLDSEEEIDYALTNFYDFADEMRIWLGIA